MANWGPECKILRVATLSKLEVLGRMQKVKLGGKGEDM